MCKDLYSVWVEWEIGQSGILFTSKEDVKKWLNSGVLDGTDYNSADEIINDGLADIIHLRIWSEDETK